MREPIIKQLWQKRLSGTVYCCYIGDLKKKGKMNIIAGDSEMLRVFDAKGKEKDKFPFKERVFDCCVADINRDGKKELVVRGFFPRDPSIATWQEDVTDLLLAVDHKGKTLWSEQVELQDSNLGKDRQGNFVSFSPHMRSIVSETDDPHFCIVGDVTNDGKPEIVVDLAGKTLVLFSGDGGLVSRDKIGLPNRIGCLLISDITGDGMNEILTGTQQTLAVIKVHKQLGMEAAIFGAIMSTMFPPGVEAISFTPRREEAITRDDFLAAQKLSGGGVKLKSDEVWRKEFDERTKILSCDVGDVTNNRKREIVIGGATGSLNGFVAVLNWNGEELWQKDFENIVRCCVIGDVTHNRRPEIVIGEGSTL